MSHDRFYLLLEKYLEKALTPSEREEFQALLEQDSRLRAEFISALTQASMLRRIHRNKITQSARIEAVNIKKARIQKRDSEANIFKRKGSYFALAALAAMVVCAVLLKFSQHTPVEPLIEFSEAPAEKAPAKVPTPDLSDVTVEAGKSLKLAAEDYFGRKIITSERASALISYKDGTTIELKASTRIKLSPANSNKGKELEALNGRIIVNAAPQPKDMPLQIKSIDGTASVIGTLFWLNVDEQGTRVDLLDGKINLIRAGDNTKIQLEAGQKAVMAPTVALTATPIKLVDGPLLYSEAFDAELKNWKTTGAKLALATADISEKTMPTAKMQPIPPGTLCAATLDFSRVFPRHADCIAINFNMRSLIPLKRDNQIWFVPHFGAGVKVEDDFQTPAPKQPKYVFRRFIWKKLRIEIHRTRGENGMEGFRYHTFIDGALFEAKKVSGPLEGLRISTIDLPFEFSNLQVYELVPEK